jgi:hypothetical protein
MQALKRNRDGKEWTKLPAAGRLAEAPEWPAAVPEPNEDELLKWREVWTLPQALVWEMDRSNDLVAFYVRTYLEAMNPKAGAQARMFVRQLSNDLFLTPAALASGRYVIDGTREAELLDSAIRSGAPPSNYVPTGRPVGRPKGSRNKFTVVPPTADEDLPKTDEHGDEQEPEGDIPF